MSSRIVDVMGVMMDDFGFSKWMLIGLGVFFFVIMGGRAGGARAHLGGTLVLRRFSVDATGANGVYVEIVGRNAGLVGWLLSVIGLDDDAHLRLTAQQVSLETLSLQGRSRAVVPMACVASAAAGYEKSLSLLIIGSMLAMFGLYDGLVGDSARGMLGSLLLGGIFLFFYWLSKRLSITIETTGGSRLGLRFKRSLIENVEVDFDKASAVVDMLEGLALAAQARRDIGGPVASPAMMAAPAPAPEPEPVATSCGSCGSPFEPGTVFCGNCGARVGD